MKNTAIPCFFIALKNPKIAISTYLFFYQKLLKE